MARDDKRKIILYQMPLFERIMGIWSAVILTLIPIICLWIGVEKVAGMIVLLLAMLVYCVYMYFNVFKTYICLDVKNQKLIIRESPGIKKEEFYIKNIIDIKVSDGEQYKNLFTIDIRCVGYTKKILSWSAHPTCRLAVFHVYQRQTKRLAKFTKECNKYLNSK